MIAPPVRSRSVPGGVEEGFGRRLPATGDLMDEARLIHDWNTTGSPAGPPRGSAPELDDETLRDGLQNPSVVDPPLADKLRLLHLMDDLGIDTADVGLPGAGPRARAQVEALVEEIRDAGLAIRPNCAARTVIADIEPIVDVQQATGVPIEAYTFIGSSPIRQYAEGWTLDRILGHVEEAVTFATREGLSVSMVTEDTTRAAPATLVAIYRTAIEHGARRICLADTVGHAIPEGVRALVRFVIEEIVDPSGEEVAVDWHGHRDRGLGVINALTAFEAGASRLHGTALGIGERVGNTEMDLLMVNLRLLGWIDRDLSALTEYCETAARACRVEIPHDYPVFGTDAFRTTTGVHAAAIVKAREKGASWLADRVYSGVPASWVGRDQRIEIGPMSGLSNVKCWLAERGLDHDDEALCARIITAAKAADHTLTEDELSGLVTP
ncbi:MAG: LeuA family protein [Longimicrobiales bacterium]|nr:LeuA family protein [Longimicrobiales bacterium]